MRTSNNIRNRSIAIVGEGPAGAVAALLLAREGAHVTVRPREDVDAASTVEGLVAGEHVPGLVEPRGHMPDSSERVSRRVAARATPARG